MRHRTRSLAQSLLWALRAYAVLGGAPASSSMAQASTAQGGRSARDAGGGRRTGQTPRRSPTRRTPPRSHTPHWSSALPSAAEPPSYLPYHGLPGIEPEQPNPPKTTASSAGPTARARRCRSYPRTSLPLQHTHQLQESGARRAIPPGFISNPTLPHQHHAQPRRRIALFAKYARVSAHTTWPDVDAAAF